MIKVNLKLVLGIVLVVGVSSCNKDNIIESEETIGGVLPPSQPSVPNPVEPADDVFAGPSYFYRSTTRYTFVGRPVFLTPLIKGESYKWSVDGVKMDCDGPTFKFTPDAQGEYTVAVTINDEISGELKVVCVDRTEGQGYRAGTSSVLCVYEYVPAPGQFINENMPDMSPTEAARWAEGRIADGEFVSLGGFGGYIIVGFPHSIGDFKIKGNAFSNAGGASNEPGIVYVMQDINGNGLPDDEWYELRASETDAETTVADYAVTYYRPQSPGSPVKWIDNFGVEGEIAYMAAFHKQDYYYPSWISDDSYTLRGTKVAVRAERNEAGQWFTYALDGGYADNMGDNNDTFYISDAMFADQTPADLMYIDFIKIQTGATGQCGILGEISTEVVSINER